MKNLIVLIATLPLLAETNTPAKINVNCLRVEGLAYSKTLCQDFERRIQSQNELANHDGVAQLAVDAKVTFRKDEKFIEVSLSLTIDGRLVSIDCNRIYDETKVSQDVGKIIIRIAELISTHLETFLASNAAPASPGRRFFYLNALKQLTKSLFSVITKASKRATRVT